MKLEFNNNTIWIIPEGEYKGADGNMYPYTASCVEGVGIHKLWEYIQGLESQVKITKEGNE
jgi:hypothetical protein